MDLDRQIDYLLQRSFKVPVFKPASVSLVGNNDMSQTVECVDVKDVVGSLVRRITTLEIENKSLRGDFLWCLKNSSQVDWITKVKDYYMDKYFKHQPEHEGEK